MKALLIVISTIVVLNAIIAVVFFCLKRKEKDSTQVEKPNNTQEPQGNEEEPASEHTLDSEKPSEPVEEPEIPKEPDPQEASEEPTQETDKPDVPEYFSDLFGFFTQIVPIPRGGLTYNFLVTLYEECIHQYFYDSSVHDIPLLFRKELFKVPYNYWEDNKGDAADTFQWLCAWVFAMALAELRPTKRDMLYRGAYDYLGNGKNTPTYGYDLVFDPNIARMVAGVIYAATRDGEKIPAMREEACGSMITYKDISETYVDCTKFMPSAPYPYVNGYTDRKEYPIEACQTYTTDKTIHEVICLNYKLDTKDAVKRQQTIQAIANKEYKKPHLFGKPRTVNDPKFGVLTFNPVFGVHNIGVEIPEDGVIADLCYTLGKVCSATRTSLLNQEYGRRRPGQGDTDGSANADPKQRALVNYAIEEGDGRSTGFYNQNGDYVSIDTGQHIGDYETYCQSQLYANSYPSGHSAYIEGVGLVLMMVMPDKADVILKAVNEFAVSRCICRYHWMSDTIHGRVIGTTMIPVLAATTNIDFDNLLAKAKEEYEKIKAGDVTPEPTPQPTPTEKVNTSLAYSIGGYGSCHVDAGEKSMVHKSIDTNYGKIIL